MRPTGVVRAVEHILAGERRDVRQISLLNAEVDVNPRRAHRAAVPLVYTIDVAERLVTITGEYAGADQWNDVLTRIQHDPRYQPRSAFLRDLRGATEPVDAATVVEIAKVVRRFWPILHPVRVAILTPLEADRAALVAQALADAEHSPVRMFKNYDEAMAWLAAGLARIKDRQQQS